MNEECFSKTYGNVFEIKPMPNSIDSMLIARNSRTSKGIQTVFKTEFENNKEKKSEEFSDLIITQYGDDSVVETKNLKIEVTGSMLLINSIERSRIGISAIEKSTRYVNFSIKRDKEYLFYRGEDIKRHNAEFYEIMIICCNKLFDFYSFHLPILQKELENSFNIKVDNEEKKKEIIRTQALDTLRVILPAATLTNAGFSGNALALEKRCLKMQSSTLGEFVDFGNNFKNLVAEESPEFFKRCDPEKSHSAAETITFQKHLQKCQKDFWIGDDHPSEQFKGYHEWEDFNVLLTMDDLPCEEEVLHNITYESLKNLLHEGKSLKLQKLDDFEYLKQYWTEMMKKEVCCNRRFLPPRAFEIYDFQIDITADFKTWCDLKRHRMLYMDNTILSNRWGYIIPKRIKENIFLRQKYTELMNYVSRQYDYCHDVLKVDSLYLQYMLPMAFKVQWTWKINFRELFHVLSIRTLPEGHDIYRRICQEIYRRFSERFPFIASLMHYVNMNDVEWNRREAIEKIFIKK